jgi:hypothetical protein
LGFPLLLIPVRPFGGGGIDQWWWWKEAAMAAELAERCITVGIISMQLHAKISVRKEVLGGRKILFYLCYYIYSMVDIVTQESRIDKAMLLGHNDAFSVARACGTPSPWGQVLYIECQGDVNISIIRC